MNMMIQKTMKVLSSGMVTLSILAYAGTSLAQDTAVERGADIYRWTCATCHGRGPGDDGRAMLPGTDALRIKYNGAVPPALEDRTDLSFELLSAFVRQGSFSMPPFRKTTLPDDDLRDIAAYLQWSSQQSD